MFRLPHAVFAHGDLHDRIQNLSERLKVDPDDPELLFTRGSLYEQHGDHAAAIADFSSAEAFDSDMTGLHFAKARSYVGLEDYENALLELGRIAAPASDEGRVLLWRGRVLAKMDQPLKAAAHYRSALAMLDHASPDLFIELSRVLTSAGSDHYPGAIQALDQGIERIGPVITLNLEALDLETRMGRYQDALVRVDRMLLATPGMIPLLKRKGEILELKGSRSEARLVFEDALARIGRLPAARRATEANLRLEDEIRSRILALSIGASN